MLSTGFPGTDSSMIYIRIAEFLVSHEMSRSLCLISFFHLLFHSSPSVYHPAPEHVRLRETRHCHPLQGVRSTTAQDLLVQERATNQHGRLHGAG